MTRPGTVRARYLVEQAGQLRGVAIDDPRGLKLSLPRLPASGRGDVPAAVLPRARPGSAATGPHRWASHR